MKISTTQQPVKKKDFDEGWELLTGGWEIMTMEPPGQPHEVKQMRGKTWWRPLDKAIEDYEK